MKKPNYMTEKEIVRRLKNGESHNVISLNRWQREIPPMDVEMLKDWRDDRLGIRTCAHCHFYTFLKCEKECELYPCNTKNRPLGKIHLAIIAKDRKEIMRWRAALIKRLKRLVAKEKKNNEKTI